MKNICVKLTTLTLQIQPSDFRRSANINSLFQSKCVRDCSTFSPEQSSGWAAARRRSAKSPTAACCRNTRYSTRSWM